MFILRIIILKNGFIKISTLLCNIRFSLFILELFFTNDVHY